MTVSVKGAFVSTLLATFEGVNLTVLPAVLQQSPPSSAENPYTIYRTLL